MLWVRCSLIKGAGDNLKDYRPAAFWSRRTIQVETAFATNRFSSSVTAHSTYPIVWPRCRAKNALHYAEFRTIPNVPAVAAA
jgi:hypothetical protein